jgi:high-affinity nickel-transport protein
VVVELLFGGLIGVASGVRHAMEPDHIAAVSTLAVDEPTTRGALRFATAWGAGHAIMLVLVAGALVVTRKEMPPRLMDAFELAVAATLVALGVRALLVARRAPSQAHGHDHRASVDVRRPLLVGLVHGLAGSGALTALTLSTMGSASAGIVYVGLYGLGATLGMIALAGLAGPPLARAARSQWVLTALVALSGIASLAIGSICALQAIGRIVG